jgi:hypothetical protein
MTEPWPGCNPRSGAERVPDDLDAAQPIDQRHIKAHVAVLPRRKAGNKFAGCRPDAGDLAWQQALRRRCEAFRALHFDENRGCAIGADQVDLARLPAPTPREDDKTPLFQKSGDLILGRLPAEIGRPPRQLLAASFRASW